ncbi:unnamed protein product [Ectocarpus sp. 4 AP-2014]
MPFTGRQMRREQAPTRIEFVLYETPTIYHAAGFKTLPEGPPTASPGCRIPPGITSPPVRLNTFRHRHLPGQAMHPYQPALDPTSPVISDSVSARRVPPVRTQWDTLTDEYHEGPCRSRCAHVLPVESERHARNHTINVVAPDQTRSRDSSKVSHFERALGSNAMLLGNFSAACWHPLD